MAKLDQKTRAKLKTMLAKHKQQKQAAKEKLQARLGSLRTLRPSSR